MRLTDYDINQCQNIVKELANDNIIPQKLDVTSKSEWRNVSQEIFDATSKTL